MAKDTYSKQDAMDEYREAMEGPEVNKNKGNLKERIKQIVKNVRKK